MIESAPSDARIEAASLPPAAALLALGIVFGDIGTSPLYALEVAVKAAGGPTSAAVTGCVSLIVWAIVLTVAVKYVTFVLQADNEGEGGVFALASLLDLARAANRRTRALLVIAVLGAAALFGDAVITPAISVLSAVEGVRVALPWLDHLIVPLALAILVALFLAQRFGTEIIGRLFGPIMLLWFLTLAVLGAWGIAVEPAILAAFDPRAGLALIGVAPATAMAVLAATFLAVTGGEALYADLGQVGRRGIRLAWYGLVMPALILNYLGQGALLLADASAADEPFYRLAPVCAQTPLLVLATVATVIASQAVLTGLFSLAHQAMRLGLLPPLRVVHTSAKSEHQIVIPALNALLAMLTLGAVVAFGSSERLADAYGLSVIVAMITTTVLFVVWLRRRIGRWAWSVGAALIGLDLIFLVPNLSKLVSGGAFPVVLALGALIVSLAWFGGRHRLAKALIGGSLGHLTRRLNAPDHARLHRPVVLLARPGVAVPSALRNMERLLGVGFERLVIVSVWTANRPRVAPGQRATVLRLSESVARVDLRVGYMQRVDLPSLLAPSLRELGVEPNAVTYVAALDRIVLPEKIRRPGDILTLVFATLMRIAERAPDRYHLPSQRTLELGAPHRF